MHGVSVVMPWAGAMGFAIMGNAGPTLGGRIKRQCELPSGFHWRGVLVTCCYASFNLKMQVTNAC